MLREVDLLTFDGFEHSVRGGASLTVGALGCRTGNDMKTGAALEAISDCQSVKSEHGKVVVKNRESWWGVDGREHFESVGDSRCG